MARVTNLLASIIHKGNDTYRVPILCPAVFYEIGKEHPALFSSTPLPDYVTHTRLLAYHLPPTISPGTM